MPVDFLSEEQERRYGRFAGELTKEQLDKYFELDFGARDLIAKRAHLDANRLGFALQLGTVRFLGTFLENPVDVPAGVVQYLASQLRVEAGCLSGYGDGKARWEHAARIREHYGYREFAEPAAYLRLTRWLYTRAWVASQSPSVLFDLATAWLVERKILLPGVTVLARLVAKVRERASARLWGRLNDMLSDEQRDQLVRLVYAEVPGQQTPLDRLRRAPTRSNAMGISGALARVREIRGLGVHHLDLSAIPQGRVVALARFANCARAAVIERMPDDRRAATLVAFAHSLARTACDDVLEMFDEYVPKVFGGAERKGIKERVRTLAEMDRAALALRDACLIFFDPKFTNIAAARQAAYRRSSKDAIEDALEAIGSLARPPDDRYYERVLKSYSNLRRFLPQLLQDIPFEGTAAGNRILGELADLKKLERRRRVTRLERDDPTFTVSPSWRRHVFPSPGLVDRHALTFALVEDLQEGLRRRDVFVNASTRWGDPRRLLLDGKAWEAERPRVCRALEREPTSQAAIAALTAELDQGFRRTAENMATNPAVRIEQEKGRDTLVLTPLDALPEPPSLLALREAVQALLPRVDLPDLLLEVAAWTRFTSEFTHASEGRARVDELGTSVCAVLLAEACNIGLEPVVRSTVSSLTRSRLSWVQQNYVRAETITRANARLVNYQTTIPLAQAWGGGEVAAADGIRFTVPVRTINARPNPKYFNTERGVTYYNFNSNQFTGFHGLIVPGTLRDSPYILNGLLQHETCLEPTQLMTDTAGYSDLVFGLFWLLGFRFSPRLADLGSARLWRIDRSADYGPLNGVARQTLNTKLIAENWDDMLRVAGTLLSCKVPASEVIKALQAGGRLTTLARAISEAGRAPKTIHLLQYVDDENYRRAILIMLNRIEGRHGLARVVFHGRRGELRQHYREGQEDQLSALGLVLNAIVLWNTRYMDAALQKFRADAAEVLDEDVERLSPLAHSHVNLLGRYHFTLPEEVLRGQLRPLRDPSDPDEILNASSVTG